MVSETGRGSSLWSLPRKKNIILDSGLFQRPDLQPETKTEPQPRSHWPRLIVRARATDTRSRRGAKDSEQKTQACSSIIVPEEREKSRERTERRRKKRKKRFSYHKPRLCRTQLYLQWWATRKRNRGYGKKGVPLSQLLVSAWCRFQGGEANSSRRVREQKVDKKETFRSLFPSFFISSLRSLALSAFSSPLSAVAKTLSETGRGSSLRSLPRKKKHFHRFKAWVSF